ncbi:MAG: hypothetical protein KGQ54_01705 [Verrucomicrobia bacterium]|nr:hypothetical protein [Verrucomicrobiota bacterium]NDE63164.1 hypothetical protein [Chlamydiota bacterium]
MRLYLICLCILPLSLLGQNSATQYANITIGINSDTNKSVTITASQQTTYTAYSSSQAYILVPTVSKTLTAAEISSQGKLELEFEIQVRPVQTTAENFQLQATTLIQRFNIVSYLSPFYYLGQFYPLQVGAASSNTLYAYATLSYDTSPVKLWYQGQTTIGNPSIPSITTSFLIAKSFNNYNLIESSMATKETKKVKLKLAIGPAAITYLKDQIAGTYFFQIYLTLNPYQTPLASTTTTMLTNTLSYLNVLYSQTTSYTATPQLATNQTFLLKEIKEVTDAINSL